MAGSQAKRWTREKSFLQRKKIACLFCECAFLSGALFSTPSSCLTYPPPFLLILTYDSGDGPHPKDSCQSPQRNRVPSPLLFCFTYNENWLFLFFLASVTHTCVRGREDASKMRHFFQGDLLALRWGRDFLRYMGHCVYCTIRVCPRMKKKSRSLLLL